MSQPVFNSLASTSIFRFLSIDLYLLSLPLSLSGITARLLTVQWRIGQLYIIFFQVDCSGLCVW